MASSPGASDALAARVRDPGYTPGIRDLDPLLDLFAEEDDELARATERAVLRIEPRHVARVVTRTIARLGAATRPARGRLARLIGRIPASASESTLAEARTWLVSALRDPDLKTRHTVARALGKLKAPDAAARELVERALLDAWDASTADDDRRALAEALGKVGSEAARERLAREGTQGISQTATRAALIIERSTSRERPGAIDVSRTSKGPLHVRFHSRTGLEQIVCSELGETWRPRIAGPGLVDARLTWNAANGHYKIIVYGKNLFNGIGYDAGAFGSRLAGAQDGAGPYHLSYFVQSPGIGTTYSVNPPRTYGVELDYKF